MCRIPRRKHRGGRNDNRHAKKPIVLGYKSRIYQNLVTDDCNVFSFRHLEVLSFPIGRVIKRFEVFLILGIYPSVELLCAGVARKKNNIFKERLNGIIGAVGIFNQEILYPCLASAAVRKAERPNFRFGGNLGISD